MIQDIAPMKLFNDYRRIEAAEDSRVLHFSGREVLIAQREDTSLVLPEARQFSKEQREHMQYLFCIDQTDYFWLDGGAEKLALPGYEYIAQGSLRQVVSKEICFAVMTGFHLATWYQKNRFCGCCGKPVKKDQKLRMLYCEACGNQIFPTIAPAVIVGLYHGDKILMTKYADREYKRYALIAGFTEIGEMAEETVAREVFEEVGLKVGRIRYYKSQPWGVDSNLLLGYFAELAEENQITLDSEELALAEWHSRESMPAHDDHISLTREMMGLFEDRERFEAFLKNGDVIKVEGSSEK